jgi:hypothetical protein
MTDDKLVTILEECYNFLSNKLWWYKNGIEDECLNRRNKGVRK